MGKLCVNENKEELKEKIQKLFTKLRNVINDREDELLLEVDKKFNELYFNEDITLYLIFNPYFLI